MFYVELSYRRVSQQHGGQIELTLKPLNHHSTMELRGLQGALNELDHHDAKRVYNPWFFDDFYPKKIIHPRQK